MTVTRHARAFADHLVEKRQLSQKNEYRDKILRLQQAFTPPLSNAELDAGLAGKPGGDGGRSSIARFVSASPRLAKARPDSFLRGLIDALLAGDLLIGVRRGLAGTRREVLICDERDVKLLGPAWEIQNLAGRPLPARSVDWNDGALWNLFDQARPQAAQPHGAQSSPDPIQRPGAPISDRRIGFGAMRLSTEGRPDPETALAILAEALESGVTFFDSADSYCLDDSEVGHNEALIARALERWSGPRESITVATKAGLLRPGGRWIPDTRPEHLTASCEASLRRLGEPLDLFQLHVVDRKVPLAESVGALARLHEAGKIRRIGVCNVTLAQLEEARSIAPIFSVQNALSLFESADLRGGLVERCRELGILFVAHSPLGGHRKTERIASDPALNEIATRLEVSPQRAALAWLLSFPGVLPIPGARRIESLRDSLAATRWELSAEDLERLDGRLDRSSPKTETAMAGAIRRRLRPAEAEEVVLFVGPPAAGKTMRVAPFIERGYLRLNRDQAGGSLDDLLPWLRREIAAGRRSFVLDNTYPTRKSRRPVLEIARAANLPVRCLWLDVPIEEALYNACLRMLERHGRILEPAELQKLSRHDPNMLPPGAILNFFQHFESPEVSEGFATVERLPFERRIATDQVHKALILDYDGTLRRARGGAPFPREPDDVEILPGRRETLERYRREGFLLLGVSNQAGIGLGQISEAQARACFDRTHELLGQRIDVLFCPLAERPGGVWARKPLPGLGVELIERYRLDRRRCVFVGDQESDRLFARNLGVEFRHADQAFGPELA